MIAQGAVASKAGAGSVHGIPPQRIADAGPTREALERASWDIRACGRKNEHDRESAPVRSLPPGSRASSAVLRPYRPYSLMRTSQPEAAQWRRAWHLSMPITHKGAQREPRSVAPRGSRAQLKAQVGYLTLSRGRGRREFAHLVMEHRPQPASRAVDGRWKR